MDNHRRDASRSSRTMRTDPHLPRTTCCTTSQTPFPNTNPKLSTQRRSPPSRTCSGNSQPCSGISSKSHSEANARVLRAQLLSFRNFANPVFWQVDVAEFCKLPQKLSKKRERTDDTQDLVAQRVKYGGKGQVKTVWVPASHAGD